MLFSLNLYLQTVRKQEEELKETELNKKERKTKTYIQQTTLK